MHSWTRTAALAAILSTVAIAQTRPTQPTLSSIDSLRIARVATLEFPWGMAYLPDGRLLITEKPGRLRVYADGQLSAPVANLSAISYREAPSEQGGLLDIAVDPDFAQNRRIYLSYTEEALQQPPTQAETGDPRFASYIDLKDNRLRGGSSHAPHSTAAGSPSCR